MAMMLTPASTKVVSPVMPQARSEHRNAAVLPTSSIVTVRRSGDGFLGVAQHLAETADAGCRQRLHGTCRDRVDANALGTQIGRQEAHTGLQAGFGQAHDVVVGYDLASAAL